jgi:hypothetical protein
MTDAIYPKAKAQFLIGALDIRSGTMKALLLDGTTDYVFSSSHEFLSDVPAGARVKATQPFTGRAVNLTTGAFDSDDPTAQAVTGEDISRIILYLDTGVEATSRLIFFKDTGITTVPFTPDGSDIRIVVHANGWFKL